MSKLEDLTGQRFGYLTVISRDTNPNNKRVKWLCRCNCNKLTVVAACDLKSGHTSSCGCKKFETHNQTHGMRHTRIYNIWCGMKKRCFNPNESAYPYYGAKGVTICDEWMSFEPFFQWSMANGYNDDLTIDRIDVYGNYCPENCRWVTAPQQINNRRNTVCVEYQGTLRPLAELSRVYHLNHNSIYGIYRRLSRKGLSVNFEQILDYKRNMINNPYHKGTVKKPIQVRSKEL